MKNLYIYGYSDDLHIIDSDFGLHEEFSNNFCINGVLYVTMYYICDWKINIEGVWPSGWNARKIESTSDFWHIQIPDYALVYITETEDDD